MNGRIADDALLADFAALGLELRFDQRDQTRAGAGKGERDGEDLRQRDEAGVADDPVDRFGDVFGGEQAGRELFENDDALVLAELPGKLVGAAVDGIDASGTIGEQHVGEASGRRADVDGDRADRVPAPVIERVGELDAATRHPGMIASAHVQQRVVGERLASLSMRLSP